MKLAIMTMVAAFAFTGSASAHLVRLPDHPKRNHLENRLAAQKENLAHARYVANNGKGENARWHRLAKRWIAEELLETRRALAPPKPQSVPDIIRAVFGSAGEQAVTVAHCETGGTFDVNASNGQYLGLFQMGDYARSAFGHGPDAWTQAKAAYAYYRQSGWSPWQCSPYGGLQW